MSSKTFWGFFAIIYSILTFCQPTNWAAVVAFYIPIFLVFAWIVFWYIQWVNDLSDENARLLHAYNMALKSLFGLMTMTALFCLVLVVGTFVLNSPKDKKYYGRIVSISKQNIPFARRWAPLLLTIESDKGELTTILCQKLFMAEIFGSEKR